MFVVLALLACHHPSEATPPPLPAPATASAPAPAPAAAPAEVTFTAEEEAMITALSSKDAAPPCDTLAALVPDPSASFVKIAENLPMPPAAPIRAADCYAHTAAPAADTLGRWVTDPNFAGLGRTVLQSLDAMPLTVSVPVAQAALGGALASVAKERLAASTHPELAALAAP